MCVDLVCASNFCLCVVELMYEAMVNEVQAIDHKTKKTSYYVWQNLCVDAIGVCNEYIECNSVGMCDKANAWSNGRQSSSETTLVII